MIYRTATARKAPLLPFGGPFTPAASYLTIPPPVGSPPYADLAAAQAVIADASLVAPCYAYREQGGLENVITFTAVPSVSDLYIVNFVGIPATAWFCGSWSSHNIQGGNNLQIGFLLSPSVPNAPAITADLYDAAGNLVGNDSYSGVTSTLVIPVAVTGAYSLRLQATDLLAPGDTMKMDASISASAGSFSSNTIRAAYGAGPSYEYC